MSGPFDVIIIGFGPTGATLANLLGLSGVSTLLLDRETQACHLPRAVHFDGEVMRVFQTIGISDELAGRLYVNAGMRFVNKSTGQLLLDWPRPQEIGDHAWHASYRFHQPDLESILHENLKKYPSVEVRKGCEVLEIRDMGESVQAHYEDLANGERHSVSGKYLVGCEGARSLTRKLICQPVETSIEDFDFNQYWLVVDVILNKLKPELSDYTIQYCHLENPVTANRGPGLRRRWEFALTEKDRKQHTIDKAAIWNRLKPWLTKDEALIERYAVYQFHATLALKWRKNRLFIAGDAAHQTPPFMGQGMCAGIRDAANLAWKLSLSLNNPAKAYLLDSYQQERLDHVREYIITAIKLGELVNSTSQQDIFQKLNSPNGKMKSIAPKLGKGLAVQINKHVGTLFPQPKLRNVSEHPVLFDDHCGYAASLLISSELKGSLSNEQAALLNKFRKEGLCILSTASEPHLANILERLALKAVLIRPDRYILATANDSQEFQTLLHQLPLVMPFGSSPNFSTASSNKRINSS